MERLIYFYIDLTIIFKIRPCIMEESSKGHFAVSLFRALIWKFLTKYGNINLVFLSDKISTDSKY